jgi:TonB-linked SusC/RagA family outer membrane protein
MRKSTLVLMGVLLFTIQALAQRTISGKVTDDKGNAVANVSVAAKGTTSGTTTAIDGTYKLTVPSSAKILIFSSVDMSTVEVSIGNQSVINTSMKAEDKLLSEVVVTGYSREKKSQFVGAATALTSKVVETVPVGSFDQALQGRAPGLQVSSGSGQPGTSAQLSIRGVHSIQGAFVQPLYIVDGIPLPANDMQTINPNDFESITILKDASAAALYGARGGLGVVVITTKKGKVGAPQFAYRTQVGFTQKPNWNKFDMMNSQEILQYEEMLGVAGFGTNTPGWVYSKKNPTYNTLSAATQAAYDKRLDSFRNINVYYPSILFRQGISQTHEINISGGAEKTRYFISGSYFDQKGIELASRLRRYTTRFNFDVTAGKLNVIFNTTIGYSITNLSEGEFLGNSARNSFQMAWRAKPYENPYRPDGSIIFGATTSLVKKEIGNVLEGIQNSLWRQNQIKINSGLTLAYKIFPSLTVRNTFGIDVADDRWQRWIRAASYIGSLQANGARGTNSEAYEINANLINTSALVYAKRFSNMHDVEVGGYFEVIRNYNKGLGFTIWNLDPRIDPTGQNAGPFPVAQTQQYGTSASGGYGIRSYFGTARYTFNNKYTITANARQDGTSRIVNEENREIFTWSVGGSWNAIQEKFFDNVNFLSDLKVRASYGAVPNIGSISTGGYGAGGGLVTVTNFQGPQVPSFSSAAGNQYANSGITGQAPSSPGNPNLKIETIRKINIGADIAAFKNRVKFTIDVYNEKTEDLFVNQALPATSGFGSGFTTPINAGIMRNKGVELTVSVDVVKTKDFDLTIGANHAINNNKIEDLGQVSEIPQGTFIIREGLPYGSHYSQHYLGADPATGRPRFEKQDGTETLNPAEAYNFAKYGTFIPKHVGGFNLEFRFKRVSVSALFSYQLDVTRYNNIENWVRRGIIGYHSAVNASRVLLTQQWQKPGDNVFYQSPAYDRGFNSSDIQDAKFLRFRNLLISYAIPEFNIGGVRMIKSGRLYVQGQNIAIWSPWRGPDPEDNNNISLNEFPNPRMIVAGLDINF